MDNSILNPGGTLGIIGSSTNGVGLVIAARNAGINVGVYGDNENTETMELADFRVVGALNDQQQLQNFAERCDMVTYESETIDASVINFWRPIPGFHKAPMRLRLHRTALWNGRFSANLT